jgi:ankyrin repeat protein
MHLLKLEGDGEFSLVEVIGDGVPPYAILSHRWGALTDEVNYKDLENGTGRDKIGYKKLTFGREQASLDKLEYFWIDTCCIDKANFTELSEAINSMFKWYRDAAKCYVYLPDVSIHDHDDHDDHDRLYKNMWEAAFRKSTWFTRGWTLQELIAPASVQFFSVEGKLLGDKQSLEQQIHEVTGIDLQALRGSPLSEFHFTERMSWAEKRQTTIAEDSVYCLFGIFDIHMPLIYGEGRKKALTRLEREVREALAPTFSIFKDDSPWIVANRRNQQQPGTSPSPPPMQPSDPIGVSLSQGISTASPIECKHLLELNEPLYDAVRVGDTSLVERLLGSGLSADVLNSALITACLHGKLHIARGLIQHGANVESFIEATSKTQWIGGSALMITASRHHYHIVHILLDAGAAVNRTHGDRSALLQAIRCQKGYYSSFYEGTHPGSDDSIIKTVAVLLKRGADPNVADVNHTALGYCTGFSGTPLKVLDLLVQFGADAHEKSVLQSACGKYTNNKYLEWLEKQNVPFTQIDDYDKPPFIYALENGKAKKVKFFLDREAVDLRWTDDANHDVLGMLASGTVHLYSDTAEIIECILNSPQGKALDRESWKKAVDIAIAMYKRRNATDSPQTQRIIELLRRGAAESRQ